MMETSFFLSRQTLIALDQPGHGDVARKAVRLDAAQRRQARWSSSGCRPTGWWNWAARWRSERAGARAPPTGARSAGGATGRKPGEPGRRSRGFAAASLAGKTSPNLITPKLTMPTPKSANCKGASRRGQAIRQGVHMINVSCCGSSSPSPLPMPSLSMTRRPRRLQPELVGDARSRLHRQCAGQGDQPWRVRQRQGRHHHL